LAPTAKASSDSIKDRSCIMHFITDHSSVIAVMWTKVRFSGFSQKNEQDEESKGQRYL
jgi:hypothetical protein